jgi:hypothetical protein
VELLFQLTQVFFIATYRCHGARMSCSEHWRSSDCHVLVRPSRVSVEAIPRTLSAYLLYCHFCGGLMNMELLR